MLEEFFDFDEDTKPTVSWNYHGLYWKWENKKPVFFIDKYEWNEEGMITTQLEVWVKQYEFKSNRIRY